MIGSFWPYATTLWSYIRRAQPFDAPGSLAAELGLHPFYAILLTYFCEWVTSQRRLGDDA